MIIKSARDLKNTTYDKKQQQQQQQQQLDGADQDYVNIDSAPASSNNFENHIMTPIKYVNWTKRRDDSVEFYKILKRLFKS